MSAAPLLAYLVEGDGPAVLLLNGGMMSIAAWDAIAAPLRERHMVVRCDLRGQLLSPGPPPATFAGHVGDVVALLDHLRLERVHTLGTSFGGEVAVLLAAMHPGRVASLVATTAADRFTRDMEPAVRRLRLASRRAVTANERVAFFELMLPSVYSAEFLARAGDALRAHTAQRAAALPADWYLDVDAILATLETLDLSGHLGAVACPTLVVSAGRDAIIPAARSVALAAGIRGARHVVVPESGHALVVEQPARLTELALDFLAEVTPHA